MCAHVAAVKGAVGDFYSTTHGGPIVQGHLAIGTWFYGVIECVDWGGVACEWEESGLLLILER